MDLSDFKAKDAYKAVFEPSRLLHSYLVCGEDGEDKSALINTLAAAMICESGEKAPCGVCRSCKKSLRGLHPDIIRVTPPEGKREIPIDTVRDVRAEAVVLPNEADRKVFIIEQADLMKEAAQNAFLKLFEEPPPRVMFVVTCRSAMNLLETIRSRACLLRASWPGAAPDEDAVRAAELAGRFAVALVSASEADALMLTGTFSRPAAKNPQVRKELAALLSAMRSLLRDALVIGAGAPSDTENGPAAVIAGTLPPERVAAMLDELPALEQALRTNAPIPLFTTAMCVRLRRAAGR